MTESPPSSPLPAPTPPTGPAQPSQEQVMRMLAAAMGGGGPPQPPPRPSPWTVLKAVLRFTGWLFAAPEGSRRRGLHRAVIDWFLPSVNPIEPIPAGEHHAAGQSQRLYQLANSYPLPTWRPLARAVITLTALFLAWAMVAQLDEVSIAEGEVVPEGKVKVIQHLEGGVVREIHINEGDEVKEGQPLMQIELPVSSLNHEELQVRLDGYMLQRARLEAELGGTALVFPAEDVKRQPKLVESERRSFEARRQALQATLAVLQQQVQQKGLEVQEYETKQRTLAISLRLTSERFEMSKDLMKSGLASRMDHIQMESQVEDLKGQIESIRASIPRAQAAQQEAKSRMEEELSRFKRTAQGELSEAELNIARTRELLSQANDQQRRAVIASPIDGIVKNMRSNTIGGVIKPGDPIMEIVPLHERLQIDTKLNPMDRGYVQLGQRATVKISAYDYTTYGGLEGTVILVAPDTTVPQTPNAQPYYRVVVQTDKAYIGDESAKRLISSGMQASVEIHTGTRSVMEFLVKPVLKLRHEAFRER